LFRRRVTVPGLADICGTDVEIFRHPFTTTIHAESRTDAPAALLDQLDALGLLRCGGDPRGVWHQVPDHLDEPTGRRVAGDAATALTKAGWRVNIDPGVLAALTSDHAAITAAIENRNRTGQATAEPAVGSTPRIRGIATPSTDRYPALLALDTAHLLDRVTESLVRADRNNGGFIVMTSIVPEISPLAALGRLLNAAGTHLHKAGIDDMSRLLFAAADTLTDLIANLNNHAGSQASTQMRERAVPAPPAPRPADVSRKAR
jgi:hypothetical protein